MNDGVSPEEVQTLFAAFGLPTDFDDPEVYLYRSDLTYPDYSLRFALQVPEGQLADIWFALIRCGQVAEFEFL